MEKDLQKITSVIGRLREQFYVHDFEILNNMLICRYTNEAFFPDDIIIEKIFRFEYNFKPFILYAITTKSSTQGILMNVYSRYSEMAEFMGKVHSREEYENTM
jgi:hypothetical protein